MAFDVEGAKAAGYTDGEIADSLAQTSKFDMPAALKAGYSHAEVISLLSAPKPDAGLGLMDRIGGYLKNAANNVAPTEPDPTADMIMPKRDAVPVSDSMGPPSPTKPVTMNDWNKAPTAKAQAVLDGGDMPIASAVSNIAKGAARGTAELEKTVMSIVGASPVIADRIESAITGTTTTKRGDAYFSSHVEKYDRIIDQFTPKPDERMDFADKIGYGIGEMLPDLAVMIASGGLAAEGQIAARGIKPMLETSEYLRSTVMAGFDSMKYIMVNSGRKKASEVLDSGGTAGQATAAATTAALMAGYMGSAPMSVEGQAFKRALTGLPVGSLTTEMQRQISNYAAQPGQPQQPFNLEENMVGAVTGSMMAGAMGHPAHQPMRTREQLGYAPTDNPGAPAKVVNPEPAAPPLADTVRAPDAISRAPTVADAIDAATASVPNIDPSIIQGNHATSLDTTTGIAGEMNRIRALRKAAEPVAEPAVEPVVERLAPEDKPVGPDLSTPADIHPIETLPDAPADGSRPNWEATITPEGMTVRERDHAGDQARVDEFNAAQSGSNSLGESNGLKQSVPVRISDKPDTPQIAVARGMADLLGTKLIVVEGEGGATPFNGVNFHGDATGRTIFVSADSPISALSVFGHEVGHDFQAQHPDLYGKTNPDGTYSGLLGILHPLIGEARIAERQALYERAGKPITHEQALGEVVNDMLGNRIGEKTFWSYVAKKNVGVFQQLATVVKATLARVQEGMKSFGGDGKPFGMTVKQLREANGHIDQAMSKYLDDATQAKVNLDAEHMATKPIAEKAATAPVESAPGDQHQAGGMRTHEVPVHMIKQSKDVPQFKSDAAENGVVEALGGKFDRTGVAPIQLWKRINGDLEVISGRHRLDLAQRSGEKTIPAQVHHEADGFTAQHAGAMDSVLNIRDGQGKVKDYVNYFRHTSISRSDAEQHGLLARSLGKRAFAIATEGGDGLIAAHRDGRVSDEAAVAIAAAAPGDERLQAVGLQALQDGKSIGQAANLVRAVKLLSGPKDSTGDMFGFDDSGMREAEAMARIATKTQRDLQERLSAISGAAKRPELAKKEGIKVGDAPALLKRIEEIKAEKAAWDNWTTNPELVEKIRAELRPGKPEGLDSYTPAEVLTKEARDAQGQRSDAKESSDQQNKLKADAEVGEFTLSGSDRAADADPNQNTMFSAKEGKEGKPDKANYSVREDQTETPNFKRWSDNAPVIRAAEAATHDFKTGKPVALQAYHGTAKTFESFGELRGTYTAADGKKQSTYYLTPDAGLAGQYAKDRQRMGSKLADIPDSAPNTMPVYVAMKSPLVVDAKGKNYIDVHDDAIGHAIDKGHDGVIVRNVVDAPNGGAGKPSDVYIAFKPEQIKSATGNNGEYSPTDPRINYSATDPADSAAERKRIELPGAKMLDAASTRVSDLIDHALTDSVYSMVAPMSGGTQKTRSIAQEYVNAERVANYQWGQMEEALTKHFTEDQLHKMWVAADEQNVLLQQVSVPMAGKGLDRLNPEERAAVERLHAHGEELLQRAKDVGMFKGEGLPYWTPRMAVMLDDAGDYTRPPSGDGKTATSSGDGRNITTTAASLKGRKYLTADETEAAMVAKFGDTASLVKDIRTMPLAMAKLERAIAGRELVNQIKDLGRLTGKELVSSSVKPNFFTIDHPAFTTFEPRMGEGADGKQAMLLDEHGAPIMDKKPIYISKDFEGPLKAIMSQTDGDVYRGYMLLKSKSMAAIMVSPLTHNMVIAGRAFAYAGLKLPVLYFTGHVARLDHELMVDAISHGMVPISGSNHSMIDVGDIARGLDKIGPIKLGAWGNPNESWISLGAQAIGNKIAPGMGNKAKAGIDKAGDFWHGTLLWNRIGDLQAGIFQHARAKALKRGMDANAASTYAAHEANRYAGAIGKENMSAATRKWANVLLFSRSFTMGNLGAVKDIFYGMPAGLRAQLMEHSSAASAEMGLDMAKRKAFSGLVMDLAATILITSITQDWVRRNKNDPIAKQLGDALAGYPKRAGNMLKHIEDHPLQRTSYNPYRLSSTFHNEPGKEDRIDLGAKGSARHEYLRLPTGKVIEDTIGWLLHPVDTAIKKASPLAKGGGQIVFDSKGYGVPVYNPSGSFIGHAMDAAILMASTNFPMGTARAAYDMAQGKATSLDREKFAGDLTGFSVSQGHPLGPVGALAAKVEEKVKAGKAYQLEPVKRLLKYGDVAGARALLKEAGMTPPEVMHTITRIQNPKAFVPPQVLKKFNQHATQEGRDERREMNR